MNNRSENYNRLHEKIVQCLQISCNKESKNHWYTYITALLDFDVISETEYKILRDIICVYGVVK